MLMYNFVSAFAACLVIILLGEVLSKFTKGWVPSVFISAVLILIAFWTFLPKTLVADSKLLPLGSSVAIFLLITHMGTLFSLERLLQQWKTVVICIGSSVRSSWTARSSSPASRRSRAASWPPR